MKLSERIVQNLQEYWIERGIKKNRLSIKGYGETQILNHCKNGVECPDDDHRKNRRFEIKIIKKS